ncbi:MAG: hypothetical protein CSA58_07050 [Micrococcales bacterium]|nr:MAG: hypothetical protein CSB46_07540 [Micrococcales bacterium]PIE26922.1 MAG: hypothetical protein CSA58_07050 [Micrococcales bacterium]
MFGLGRTKSAQPLAAEPVRKEHGKNRPTPKRREAEAANRRPIVVNDRKAAQRTQRDKNRQLRNKQRQAVNTGDEAHLPPQHAGPVRRTVRDIVDSRFNIGELYLPVVLLLLVGLILPGLLSGNTTDVAQWQQAVSMSLYAFIAAVAFDTWLSWRRTKRQLRERFGDDVNLRGLLGYLFTRSISIRSLRRPPVKVKRGQQPR